MSKNPFYPAARYRPVKGMEKDPVIRPIGVILHVAGSKGRSLFNWFNGPSKGVESHLYIPYIADSEQYRPFNREADANYLGNSWIEHGERVGYISIETEGLANGLWTPTQLLKIKYVLSVLHEEWNIPLVIPPTYRSPGVGYHVMFGTGKGKKCWSSAKGKVCPGPGRIKQYHQEIVPWMHDVMHTPKPPSPKPVPHLPPHLPVRNIRLVKRYQMGLGVRPDGIFGPKSIERDNRMRCAAMIITAGMRPKPYNIKDVQEVLGVRADGIVGLNTINAMHTWVSRVQALVGVHVDGVFGPKTNSAVLGIRHM